MERANTGFTTKPYVEGRTVAAAFLLLTLTQLKLETLEEKNDVEVVVLSRASAAADAADGGAGAAALRLPSPRRAQPHAPFLLRRRFRQARPHFALRGLLPPGQELHHQNHAQADRGSSRRSHCNRILSPFLSYLFFSHLETCVLRKLKKTILCLLIEFVICLGFGSS